MSLAQEINSDEKQPQRAIMNYLAQEVENLNYISKKKFFKLIKSSADNYLRMLKDTNTLDGEDLTHIKANEL